MSNARNATIYDVATAANVSASTVSRVLGNSTHPVSADLREKILRTAQNLGYIPNAQARSLKTQSSCSVGVIIPSIDNPFYPQLVRGMSDVAMERGYSIYLSNCDREYDVTDQQIQRMLELNVKGIISVFLDRTTPRLRDFVDRGGVLVTLCGKNYCFDGAYNFRQDIIGESYLAMQHLLSLGHRKIALLLEEVNCQIRADKLEGYRKALSDYGIAFEDRYLYIYGRNVGVGSGKSGNSSADRGKELARALLETSPDVTAILCMNDMMALGACAELKAQGMNVPGDFSVMGFDDAFFSEYTNPSLTTIALKKHEWGRLIMQFLIESLEMQNPDGSRYVPDGLLPPVYLIARESTGAPRRD